MLALCLGNVLETFAHYIIVINLRLLLLYYLSNPTVSNVMHIDY